MTAPDIREERPLQYLAKELKETRDTLRLALKLTEDDITINAQIWDSMTPALASAVRLEIKLAWAKVRDDKQVANRDQ